jgi:hypothetical protein
MKVAGRRRWKDDGLKSAVLFSALQKLATLSFGHWGRHQTYCRLLGNNPESANKWWRAQVAGRSGDLGSLRRDAERILGQYALVEDWE